mgnify:FL=1
MLKYLDEITPDLLQQSIPNHIIPMMQLTCTKLTLHRTLENIDSFSRLQKIVL